MKHSVAVGNAGGAIQRRTAEAAAGAVGIYARVGAYLIRRIRRHDASAIFFSWITVLRGAG